MQFFATAIRCLWIGYQHSELVRIHLDREMWHGEEPLPFHPILVGQVREMRQTFAASFFELWEVVVVDERAAPPFARPTHIHGRETEQLGMEGKDVIPFHVILINQLPVRLDVEIPLACPADGG